MSTRVSLKVLRDTCADLSTKWGVPLDPEKVWARMGSGMDVYDAILCERMAEAVLASQRMGSNVL